MARLKQSERKKSKNRDDKKIKKKFNTKKSAPQTSEKKAKKEKKKQKKLAKEESVVDPPVASESPKKSTLLSDDEDENDNNELTINNKFAEKYHKKKKRAELHRVKQEFIKLEKEEMEKSDSETEDEDATMFEKPEWEDEFLKLLPRIAAKDRSILKKKDDLFQVDDEANDDAEDEEENNETETPGSYDLTATTSENPKMKKIKEKLMTGQYGIESDEEESVPKNKAQQSKLTPAEEESRLRLELLKAAESDDDDTLFVKKKKSKKQLKKEEEDFIAFEKKHQPVQQDEDTDLNLLKNYWKSKQLNENESFLRNYILNRGWLDTGKIGEFDDNRRHEVSQTEQDKLKEIENLGDHDSTDEEALEAAERFEEEQARFRHQEICPTLIGQKRNVEESVRKKDTRRAEKRKIVKERKREEKETKGAELVRLQKEKRREIIDLLAEIQKETGSKLGKIERMDVDSLGRAIQQLDHDLQSEKNMEILEKREKLDLLMEEYYKAHYEDVIGDDTFTRFNYIKVPKQTFGLSLEEIVFKDESNLKALAPSKYLAPYNEDTKSNRYWHHKKWNIQQEPDHKFNRPDFPKRNKYNTNKSYHSKQSWNNSPKRSNFKGNTEYAQKKIQKRSHK